VFNLMQNWFEAAQFGADMQRVMTLRMMRMAAGGPHAAAEAQRMVSEKVAACGEAQIAMMIALATGRSLHATAKAGHRPYRKRVRANRRRLRK